MGKKQECNKRSFEEILFIYVKQYPILPGDTCYSCGDAPNSSTVHKRTIQRTTRAQHRQRQKIAGQVLQRRIVKVWCSTTYITLLRQGTGRGKRTHVEIQTGHVGRNAPLHSNSRHDEGNGNMGRQWQLKTTAICTNRPIGRYSLH